MIKSSSLSSTKGTTAAGGGATSTATNSSTTVRTAQHRHRHRRRNKASSSSSSRHSPSGRSRYRLVHHVLPVLLTSTLVLLVCTWILGAIYITTTSSSSPSSKDGINNDIMPAGVARSAAVAAGGRMKSPPPAPEHALRGRGGRGATTPTVTDSTNVIDMRNLTATLPFDDVDGGAWKQGWEVIPEQESSTEPLRILVVPHSHCDPGWIKTFDEYFQSQTKRILSTVIEALAKDRRRKFIWAEISYFEWWWNEQSSEVRALVKTLLQRGQLEFVTGGWVQPDEANTQLYAMDVQLEEGHDFIRREFGEQYIPKYGWSIDPFGYSPTMAYLLHKYDFQGMLIQRVHYAVKKELAQRKHLEFMWRQTWDDHGQNDIFTHVMPFFSYDVPHTCGPDPSICCQFDFARIFKDGCPWHKPPQRITSHNVKERSLLLLDQYRKKAALYRSNVVLAPLGDDFRYMTTEEAEVQYQNYQMIMDYINENVDHVTMEFGTLSEYFTKVRGTFDVPVLKGSFFTYADREQDYWSGYYTSRIFDKALDRTLERVLFAAESLGGTKQELQEPRRALSLFQHHDGVTGTAKDHVVVDYAKRIHHAIHQVQEFIVDKLKLNSIGDIQACWQSDAPRGLSQNLCLGKVHVYNPLETSQYCGDVEVHGHSMEMVQLPCEVPGAHPSTKGQVDVRFDPLTGLMTHPVQEQWMVWKVREGGAYLFHPGRLQTYPQRGVTIHKGGYVVSTPHWKRKVIVHEVTDEFGAGHAQVIDFVYETNLQTSNEEWFVRFSSSIQNEGVFHTDLNGFNFDTHYFRKDLPIQSQVFPMPTLASIEDDAVRMTVLSEHAQGTASLEDGSIDVWLDRRLTQDDGRGLFQGVTDNVPTRTRLRLLLEEDGYSTKGEFDITPLCRRMWDELNHPLEMFGEPKMTPKKMTKNASAKRGHVHGGVRAKTIAAAEAAQGVQRGVEEVLMTDRTKLKEKLTDRLHEVKVIKPPPYLSVHEDAPIVPFVYMVHKRVDCLELALDTLRQSDFDRERVPLIISHDGRVPEVVSYVEELKSEFNVIQIFHPYSCFEHPDSFPGNNESLNVGYGGDSYGNKRNGTVTCCKHHFTWMIKTVFDMEFPDDNINAFAFFEEDYVVAPTIYESVVSGLNLHHELSKKQDSFGVVFEGRVFIKNNSFKEGWRLKPFKSGPFVLTRDMWTRLVQGATEYCTYDDYNWDWSIYHVMQSGRLPTHVLYPTIPQTMHVGVDGGMHSGQVIPRWRLHAMLHSSLPLPFHGTEFIGTDMRREGVPKHSYGGWGHQADIDHCLKVWNGTAN